MHLYDHPLAGALFERARPAAVVPPRGLPIPFGVIVEKARIPRRVAQLCKFEAQISHRKIGGLEFISHPEAFAHLLERLESDNGGF